MAIGATKVCRVCGAEYQACRSAKRADGGFRWQEVACSPECGAIYLERVIAARAIPTKAVEEPVVEEVEAVEEIEEVEEFEEFEEAEELEEDEEILEVEDTPKDGKRFKYW